MTAEPDSASAPDVSVLIVGYNSLPYLPDCIAAIGPGAVGLRCEILFVNNGSDASAEYLAQAWPEVRVLAPRGNVGFAAGNNYLARQAKGRFLLLLNPDTAVEPGAIAELVAAADEEGYAAVGGLFVDAAGALQDGGLVALPGLRLLLLGLVGRAMSCVSVDMAARVSRSEAIHGSFMLVRHERWLELGGFDESFFLYAEETDFCKRLGDAGGRIGVVPAARTFHDLGSGESLSPQRIRFHVTGVAHYLRKHNPPVQGLLLRLLLWVALICRFLRPAILGLARPQYRNLARTYVDVAFRPWLWMRGYDSPGADPRRAA